MPRRNTPLQLHIAKSRLADPLLRAYRFNITARLTRAFRRVFPQAVESGRTHAPNEVFSPCVRTSCSSSNRQGPVEPALSCRRGRPLNVSPARQGWVWIATQASAVGAARSVACDPKLRWGETGCRTYGARESLSISPALPGWADVWRSAPSTQGRLYRALAIGGICGVSSSSHADSLPLRCCLLARYRVFAAVLNSCACVPGSRIQPHRDGSGCVRCETGRPTGYPRRSICGRGRERTCDPHPPSSFRCAAASR